MRSLRLTRGQNRFDTAGDEVFYARWLVVGGRSTVDGAGSRRRGDGTDVTLGGNLLLRPPRRRDGTDERAVVGHEETVDQRC